MLNVLAFCFLCGSIISEANYPIKNLTFVGDGTMSLIAGNGAKAGEGGDGGTIEALANNHSAEKANSGLPSTKGSSGNP